MPTNELGSNPREVMKQRLIELRASRCWRRSIASFAK
jgi:hypothetical protein